jgi:hypothetical protein
MIAFLTDALSIRRILDHLGLGTPAQDKPPPVREILRVAEQGESWGVPQAGSDLAVCRLERGAVRPPSDPRRRHHSSARYQTGPAAGRQGLEALAHPQATLRRLPPAAAVPCPSRPRKENPID